jgi:hypothetical protein
MFISPFAEPLNKDSPNFLNSSRDVPFGSRTDSVDVVSPRF